MIKQSMKPTARIRPAKDGALCSISGCGLLQRTRGCCNRHYLRLIRHGSATAGSYYRELHGLHGHAMYSKWQQMKQRCNNPSHPRYRDWGGRGISVCERWNNSFRTFVEDIGVPSDNKMSLDRINNDGNYEPGNVRWATPGQQLLNTRTRRDNRSGFKCVYFDVRSGKWRSIVKFGGDRVFLGTHADLETAANIVYAFRVQILGIPYDASGVV